MAYFLQAKTNNGGYKTLDIKKSTVFQENYISKTYKKVGGYSIQELDYFTMLFDDEQKLKNHLLISGILPYNLEKQELVIRFINKNRSNEYSLLFADDLEYFYVPETLINFVNEKYILKDFKFLNELARYFYWYRECSSTAAELVSFSEMAINSRMIDKEFLEYDSNGDNLATRLAKLLIYKYVQSPNGNIIYQSQFNWRTLHVLIGFIKSYDKKEKCNSLKESIIVTETIQSLSKPKQKSLKRQVTNNSEELEFEQLSFIDWDN